MDSLYDLLKKIIRNRWHSKVTINNDGFLFGLFDGPGHNWGKLVKRVLNLLLLVCCALSCLVILVNSLVFYIHDVLLFENKAFMNQQGAFVPTQSCSREYALFMFTSSDLWANTGVQVQRGDRIKIMGSGGFNSSIAGLSNRADINLKIEYPWISVFPEKKKNRELKEAETGERLGEQRFQEISQCIYKDTAKAYFGSILYQIQNSESSCLRANSDDIYQLDPDPDKQSRFVEVLQDGTLFFAVNDMYLDNTTIAGISRENVRKLKDLKENYYLPETAFKGDTALVDSIFKQHESSFRLFYPCQSIPGYTLVSGNLFSKLSSEHRTAWYDDNAGEILICMEIEHHTENSDVSWFRKCENNYNSIMDTYSNEYTRIGVVIFHLITWAGSAFVCFSKLISTFIVLFLLINVVYVYRQIKNFIKQCRLRKLLTTIKYKRSQERLFPKTGKLTGKNRKK